MGVRLVEKVTLKGNRDKKRAVAELFDSDAHSDQSFTWDWVTKQTWARQRKAVVAMVPSRGEANLALDAGCGPGWYFADLLRKGYRTVGVDMASRMLQVCSHKHPGVALVQADIEQMPFRQGAFDVVLCMGTLTYVPRSSHSTVIKGLVSMVKPHGVIVLDVHNRYSPAYWVPRWRGDLKEFYSVAEVVASLRGAGAEVEEVQSVFPVRMLSPIVLLRARRRPV